MDPLSVAASIAAVAGALYSVSRKLRSCAKAISQATKEVKAIAKEISAFSILLRSLQNTIAKIESLVTQTAVFWQTCDSLIRQAYENVRDFDKFLKDLETLRDSRGRTLITKTVVRLKWAFRKSDLVLLRSKLETSRSTLGLYMIAIQLSLAAEQLAAPPRDERDEAEIQRLKRQVRLLKSQLRNQRSIVRDAIAASKNIEYQLRGHVQGSINLAVANETLSLAKRELERYTQQTRQERVDPRLSTSSVRSDDSSPRPGPIRPPSPPPSPPLPRTPASPPQPASLTRDAGRRQPTMAVDMTASGTWLFDNPGPSENTRIVPPGQGTHTTATGLDVDMGYRTARTLSRRQERGSRVRDADRNVVWRDVHQGDDDEG